MFSCNLFENKTFHSKPVARVHDSYLYLADIEHIIGDGTLSEDSSKMVRQYIENWIRQQLILHKAKLNLSDKQSYASIENQLNDYRTSLIIYAYQKELIKQKLDTIILEEDIQKYYEANNANLVLENNLIRAKYIQLPLAAPDQNKVKQWCVSDDQKDIVSLEEYCHQFSNSFLLDDKSWVMFENIKSELPKEISLNFSDIVKSNFIELTDSINRYLIIVKELKHKDEIAPIEYVKINIKNILLFKRRRKLLDKMEEQVYQDGIKKNSFEFY
ncbi:MAG TPA: hypothetical protein EYN89_11465 [Flavobacteriales bacterium]|nr:hypothetical protein [Flavobacteriales bacterium]